MYPLCQRDMPHDIGGTANGTACSHRGAACNARACSHGHVAPQMHIVGNLDQVVEFDTVFNHGVVQRTAVDTGVGTNFHIVADAHTAQLLNLDPLPLILCKTKAIGSNDSARMHDATLADGAVRTERYARFEPAARTDRSALLDHAHGADDGIRRNMRLGVYKGRGVNVVIGRWLRTLFPPLTQTCKTGVGVVHHDVVQATAARLFFRPGRHNDAGRGGILQMRQKLAIAEEGDAVCVRRFQRRNARDAMAAIPLENTAICL